MALNNNGTFEIVPRTDLPDCAAILPTTGVYTIKTGAQGERSFKFRLCADGSRQQQGRDFDEATSPVVDKRSLRAILAAVAFTGAVMVSGDFSNAYVRADIDKDVYVRVPPAYELPAGVDRAAVVLKLKKSLYGLHQSGLLWYRHVRDALESQGFEVCEEADYCVLVNHSSGVIIALYVDDTIITNLRHPQDADSISSVVAFLQEHFEYKDLGRPRRFLGMDFTYGSNGAVTLSQHMYIDELLERMGMRDAHIALTPASGIIGPFAESPQLESGQLAAYQQLVGALGWVATCTRPDVAHAVAQLQRHTATATCAHLQAAKRVLRYLKGTREHGLTYQRAAAHDDELIITGYADASFADDTTNRRSTTGYAFTLAGAAIIWRSKQQPLVTLSTTEAEYVALCQASQEVPPMARLFEFLGFPLGTVTIFEDNAAALFLAQDSFATLRTKHIDVKYHFVREQIKAGRVDVVAIPTREQCADVLTKPLPVAAHNMHKSTLLGSAC
jgi:Reverse transcriptase (RNA-dependent DNA polymerase)